MGQRTAFLIKRTYFNGDVNIRLVHHQWGIGRVMHNNFIRAFMQMITDRSYCKSLKDFMTIIDDKSSLYLEKTIQKVQQISQMCSVKEQSRIILIKQIITMVE